jgi:hypothetical protein
MILHFFKAPPDSNIKSQKQIFLALSDHTITDPWEHVS